MLRFRRMTTLNKFVYLRANIDNPFNLECHLFDILTAEERRSAAVDEWPHIMSQSSVRQVPTAYKQDDFAMN